MRVGEVKRKTKETDVEVIINLDGGDVKVDTKIGFFDHMLNSFGYHSGFGLKVIVSGDLDVDGHHTVEDTGIVLGKAFREALGGAIGIERFADVYLPMDEALALCAVDIGGRGFSVYDAKMPQERVGEYDTCLSEEFFTAFASNAKINLHIKALYGSNAHHITEAIFKALAICLKRAVKISGTMAPSTKGVI